MLLFIGIIFGVYLLSVNAYGFILIKIRKADEKETCPKNNSKIIIAALMGGAIGAYAGMFVFKYRLDSLVLMVFLPVIAVINGYIVYLVYKNNFGFIDAGYMISLAKTFFAALRQKSQYAVLL